MARLTEEDVRLIETEANVPEARAWTRDGIRRLADEIRRLRGLILRVGTMHAGESLAALAARYGVERAREWSEVLDEAEAIRKEQGT